MDLARKLRRMIEEAGITQRQAALYIAQETRRPFSLRTLSAWLAEEGAASKRVPQKWGVEALEARLRLKRELEDA